MAVSHLLVDLEMGQEQISKQGEEQKKADEIRKYL